MATLVTCDTPGDAKLNTTPAQTI